MVTDAQPLVSIILPVYNAKAHIARCLESIRAQTWKSLEIIVINDGSSDNVSLPVCRMYAKIDPRIVLVDKRNSGVSATRNLGITLAAGKYLQFIDSDDYIDPGFTQNLVEKAEASGADLVLSHYYMEIPDPVLPDDAKGTMAEFTLNLAEKTGLVDRDGIPEVRVNGFLPEGSLDKNTFALHLMDRPAAFYYGVMWNKLYRRDIILAHDIRCSNEVTWSEDFLFNLNYIRYADTFYATTTPGYHYVQNPQSICHTKMNLANIVSTKALLFQYYKALYEHLGLYEENRLAIHRYLVDISESTTATPPIAKALDVTVDAAKQALQEKLEKAAAEYSAE